MIEEKMRLLFDNPVISWHEHVRGAALGLEKLDIEHCDLQMEHAQTLGFDRLVCSLPLPSDPHCPPEDFIAANNIVYEATKRYPGKIIGMAFVNPGFSSAAINELERCVTEFGFVGVKLYHQYTMDDPAQFALIEKCIELDVPILMHASRPMDPATRARQPRVSNGVHMANAARRYPEATFIMAHIGGGGDWQWSIKAIADTKNVYTDIGGSVYDRMQLEESVALLGADRILFATDGSFSSCAGKILGAEISEQDKKTILAGKSFERFIRKENK